MKHLNKLFVAMLLLAGFSSQAQDSNNPWAISFGVNAVDTRVSAASKLEDQFSAAFIGTPVLSGGVRNRFQRPYRQYKLCFQGNVLCAFYCSGACGDQYYEQFFFRKHFQFVCAHVLSKNI